MPSSGYLWVGSRSAAETLFEGQVYLGREKLLHISVHNPQFCPELIDARSGSDEEAAVGAGEEVSDSSVTRSVLLVVGHEFCDVTGQSGVFLACERSVE